MNSEDQSWRARTSECLGVSSSVTRSIDTFEENSPLSRTSVIRAMGCLPTTPRTPAWGRGAIRCSGRSAGILKQKPCERGIWSCRKETICEQSPFAEKGFAALSCQVELEGFVHLQNYLQTCR